MRLYNAQSCTPYFSGSDGGAARRFPEPRSFTPRSLDQQQGNDRLLDQPTRGKDFHQLSAIPSTTTSTTGRLTPPPLDTTSLSYPLSLPSRRQENQNSETDKSTMLHLQPTPPESRPVAILPPRRHDVAGIADFDGTDEFSRSSSSTLTTTRSMMLQQHVGCTITLASDSDSKTTTESTHLQNPNRTRGTAKRWPRKIPGHQSSLDRFRKPNKYESLKRRVPLDAMKHASIHATVTPEHGHGHVSSLVPSSSPLAHGAMQHVSTRDKVRVPPSTRMDDAVKASSRFSTATISPPQVPPQSLATSTTEKTIDAKDRGRHYSSSVHAQPDWDLNNSDHDLEELGKSTYHDPVRVDFFPLQISKSVVDVRSSSKGEERLGVTSIFPKHAGTPIDDVEDGWDPLHDDPFSGVTKNSMEGAETLAWATFTSLEDLGYSSKLGSFDIGSSTNFSFSDKHDPSFESDDTSALLGSVKEAAKEHIVGSKDNYNLATLATAKGDNTTDIYDIPNNKTDATRALTRRRGIGGMISQRQPRLDFLQKPKLLGPLLEARFTRVYRQRLNRAKKDVPLPVASDKSHERSASTIGREIEAKERNVTMDPTAVSSKGTVRQANGAAPSDQDWWESLWHDQDVASPEDFSDQADMKRDNQSALLKRHDQSALKVHNKGVEAPVSASEATVLSPRRVGECLAVLAGIALEPKDILEAIRMADPTALLDLKQLENLRSLVPTPTEERMLLKHANIARKSTSMSETTKAEKFMLELCGIEGARLNLERMMFRFEFNVDIAKMCEECWLFQRISKELLESQRLGKVMGILTLIQNRLVGRTPGKKKINKTSLPSLVSMLEKAEAFSSVTGVDQPVLHYAFSRLQTTKPALLRLWDEIPSISAANGSRSWNTLVVDLEQLEQNFEDFRKFALAISTKRLEESGNAVIDTMTVQNEIDVLQTSSIGAFVIEACLRMAELYKVFDAAEKSIDVLLLHFSEEQEEPDMNVNTVFDTFARLCKYAERFISD